MPYLLSCSRWVWQACISVTVMKVEEWLTRHIKYTKPASVVNFKRWFYSCPCIIFHTLAVNGLVNVKRAQFVRVIVVGSFPFFRFFNETTQSLQLIFFQTMCSHSNHLSSSPVFTAERKIPLKYKNCLLLFVVLRTCVVHHWQPCFSCCVDFVITNTHLVAFFSLL